MRRRICLVGGAVAASSLVMAVALAPIASSKPSPKSHPLTCHLSVSIAVPDGSTQVVVPANQGTMWGSIHCAKTFGAGVESATFAVAGSGDTVGNYSDYFATGSIRGTFDLIAQEGTFGNPASANWTGTLTIRHGTGTFAGTKGKGTAVCSSPDGVHITCTEKLKLG